MDYVSATREPSGGEGLRTPKPTPIMIECERTPILWGDRVGQVVYARVPNELPQGYYLQFLKSDGAHHLGLIENIRNQAPASVSLSALTLTVPAQYRGSPVQLCLDEALTRGVTSRYEQELRTHLANPTTIQPESLLSAWGFTKALRRHLKELLSRTTGQQARIIADKKLSHARLDELTLL